MSSPVLLRLCVKCGTIFRTRYPAACHCAACVRARHAAEVAVGIGSAALLALALHAAGVLP